MTTKLFISFFKIGLFTFGGGYAMLPLLEREVCTKNNWLLYDDLLEFYAIAQSTPGVISINVATYVGYKKGKLLGCIASVFGITLPSIIILSTLAYFSTDLQNNIYFINAFKGISIVVSILIFKSLIKMFRNSINSFYRLLAYIIILCLAIILNINIVVLVVVSALFSIVINSKKIRGAK